MSAPPRPRVDVHADGPGASSYGPMVEDLAARAGVRLMGWQIELLTHWGAVDGGGLINRRVGASIPRQAGKSTCGEWWALFLAVVLGRNVLWTAHNYMTTMKTLEDFRSILGTRPGDLARGVPWFNSRISRVSSKTAQESFRFKPIEKGRPGGCIVFSTRTKTAALGSTFDVVVLDEAQEVMAEHLQALLPTTASGPAHDPQYVYLGTPRRAGSPADRFEAMRGDAVGRRNLDGLCWTEYGLDEVGDVADEARWYEANPSLGGGLASIDAIRAGRTQLDALAFAQEYLGVWLSPLQLAGAGGSVISRDHWESCASNGRAPNADRAFGVKFSPDGQTVAVVVAVVDGPRTRIELVDHRETEGSRRALAEFVCTQAGDWPCVVDGRAGSTALLDMVRAKIPDAMVSGVSVQNLISACQQLEDAVRDGEVSWYLPYGRSVDWERPDELSRCITGAYKRKIGRDGGWAFDGPGSDVCEAAALALWQLRRDADAVDMEVAF